MVTHAGRRNVRARTRIGSPDLLTPPAAQDTLTLMPAYERHIFTCINRREPGSPKGCCADKGGETIAELLKIGLHKRGLKGRMRANKAGCLDQCAEGVTVVVYPEAVWYRRVTPEDVDEIIDKHLVGGEPVERLRNPDMR